MRRPDPITLPLLLRLARVRVGLSLAELGEETGVDKSTLSRYESGQHAPGEARRLELMRTLNIPLELMSTALGVHRPENPEAREAAAAWLLGVPRRRRARS